MIESFLFGLIIGFLAAVVALHKLEKNETPSNPAPDPLQALSFYNQYLTMHNTLMMQQAQNLKLGNECIRLDAEQQKLLTASPISQAHDIARALRSFQ